jgi:uncharacterized protein (TIGR02001 family)
VREKMIRGTCSRFTLLLLCIGLHGSLAESAFSDEKTRLHGRAVIESGYQFQGFAYNKDSATPHANISYQLGENWIAGVWVGEIDYPRRNIKSAEVDYFIGYNRTIALAHSFHVSMWRYTYSKDQLSSYDYTQWILSYEWQAWLNVTLGLSDNQLHSEHVGQLLEVTVKDQFGPVTGSLTLGHNGPLKDRFDALNYVRVKAVYPLGDWQLFGGYTYQHDLDDVVAEQWAHEGVSLGISYSF